MIASGRLAPTGLGALLAAPFADRYGAGITAFTGAAILAVSTIPFVFLTAAYRALPPDKIPDATPQLNVLQRVGGAIGTAVLTVILDGQLRHHPTSAGQAGGFGTTFLWVLAITIAATVPTILLAHTEHHARRVARR